MSTFAFNTTTGDLFFVGGSIDLPAGVWTQVDDSTMTQGVFTSAIAQGLVLVVQQDTIPAAPALSTPAPPPPAPLASPPPLPYFTTDNLNSALVMGFGNLFTDASVQTMLESLVSLVVSLNPGSGGPGT